MILLRQSALGAFALSLVLVACSGGGDRIGPDVEGSHGAGDGPSKAGSRLRMASYANNDGSQAAAGWYDTKLGKECSFQRLAGTKGACIPSDVFTVPGEVFSNRYSTANPTFYLDSQCQEKKGIIVTDATCREYGVARIEADIESARRPACGSSTGAHYIVLKPFDSSSQKMYRYGLPGGGGQCCECYLVSKLDEREAAFTFEPPTDKNLDGLGVVVGDYSF